jgi:hypothetical protein
MQLTRMTRIARIRKEGGSLFIRAIGVFRGRFVFVSLVFPSSLTIGLDVQDGRARQ